MKKLSIITPTFNRGNFLYEIFDNLNSYDINTFEWIIIDDGSTDNTKSIVDSFVSNFNFKYYYQTNLGKHVAVNKGIELAENEFVVILDSDDLPLPNAINRILDLLDKLNKDEIGISVNLISNDGKDIGILQNKIFSDTIQNAYVKKKITGDKWFIWRREILRSFKFPVYDNEKFVPEGIVYNRISNANYNLVFFPDVLLKARYQLTGYSNNVKKLKENNFNGYFNYYFEIVSSDKFCINRYYLKAFLNLLILILNKSPKRFLFIFLILLSCPLIIFLLIFRKNLFAKIND